MRRFNIVIILICIFFTTAIFGQNKSERESKISVTEFPILARQTLSVTPENAKRIKYYQETDGDKFSFECKFKFENFWYSVEFDQEGKLEDIEVKVRKHQIEKLLRNAIYEHLDTFSDKYDIIKIQEQYIYNSSLSDLEFYKSIISNRNSIASNYEIIVAIKKDKQWTLKEMTYDINGGFMNSRELQTNSYEYIMH